MVVLDMLVLATTLLFLIMAVLGCVLDLSRIFLAQAKLQSEVESAALSAALELDGTTQGVEKARIAAGTYQVEFSSPLHPEESKSVRLSARSRVPLSMVRIVVRGDARDVMASAVAEHMGPESPVKAELVRAEAAK